MFGMILNLVIGWLGLGLVVSVACFAAWWLVPEVPWLTARFRNLLLMVAIVSGAGTFIYGKAAYDGASKVVQKVEQKNEKDIKKATTARRNLRSDCKRNPSGCLPDRWFRD